MPWFCLVHQVLYRDFFAIFLQFFCVVVFVIHATFSVRIYFTITKISFLGPHTLYRASNKDVIVVKVHFLYNHRNLLICWWIFVLFDRGSRPQCQYVGPDRYFHARFSPHIYSTKIVFKHIKVVRLSKFGWYINGNTKMRNIAENSIPWYSPQKTNFTFWPFSNVIISDISKVLFITHQILIYQK